MEQQTILLPNTEFKPNFISQAQLKIDRADNLPFLANELKRQRVTKKDYIAPAGKLKIIPRETDIVLNMENTGDFELTANFHNQIASKLEIPQGYYDRLKESSPDLL